MMGMAFSALALGSKEIHLSGSTFFMRSLIGCIVLAVAITCGLARTFVSRK